MARLQWNKTTGRFMPTTATGTDFPPAGTQTGQQYRDTVSGQMKIKGNAGQRDQLVQPSTTTTTPKATTTTVKPKGTTTTVKPTGSPTTTVPKGNTTTTVPKGTTPTTVPKGTTTTTVPVTTTTVPPVTTTTTPPSTFSPEDEAILRQAQEDALASGDTEAAEALARIYSNGGSGSGAASSKESKTAAYNAAILAASMTEKAGKTAQNALNLQGQNLYDTQVAAIQKYYAGQTDAANRAIDKAGADFMASMPEATAYANAQVANLPQAQQGLTGALEAYGATGQQAQGVSDQNKAYLDALAKMQTSSNAQLSQADKTYMNSLRTAAEGNRMQARQTVAGNVASLQAGDTSAANATRQGLITQGIDKAQAAADAAAAARIQAAKDYGVPKKKKKIPRK